MTTEHQGPITPSPKHLATATADFKSKHGRAPQSDQECGEAYRHAEAIALIEEHGGRVKEA